MSVNFDESIDRPSEQTLQLFWKEKADLKSMSFLRRPGVSDGRIRTQIVPQVGTQAYQHNHYFDQKFYLHDPNQGTIFNPYGQRMMRVSEDFMVAMLGGLEDEVGINAAREIMYKSGYQWGMEDMRGFLRRQQAEFEAELDKQRVDFLLETWWWPLTVEGWGTWRFDFRQKDKGLLYVDLYESAVAQSLGDIGAVVCYFYAGLFAAVFSVLARRSLGSVEMQCYSTGEDHCRFLVSDYERVDAAAFWRSEGATAADIIRKVSQM
ncbi:V4R domain-containing protein [Tuwongella immobilis]|uniref:4-vinyl reductase 4VR domain-containing protein n=1 Tax=Tuwongella immobilis TaxID=692036 RepID=A0A6C2YIR5_9BACT|nr:V4R domain-containing protein [Tuwongella immobilis]VIP01438.1 4-vinyl reductase 4VR OS=Isosphaera pallida (strain ATCC 43644 / DSM 9630 / IS1B) GN=Isop_2221 PE=4 SV=1: XylR_N: V4R [Tuwongella immobilis]VTR98406.1 4-vinyl reductase 4VR OS=Isosphaera pallida (strain ATCC 43644 / DSM 9630 / IS1B) GN=Isop_2221 PE=4 SV=1: XylR_N: V4R [Tuwongella immobilis]